MPGRLLPLAVLLLVAGCASLAATNSMKVVYDGTPGDMLVTRNREGTLDIDILLDNGRHVVLDGVRPGSCMASIFLGEGEPPDGRSARLVFLKGVTTPGRAANWLGQFDSVFYVTRLRSDCPGGAVDPSGIRGACDLADCVAAVTASCASVGSFPLGIDWQEGDHCRYECPGGRTGLVECDGTATDGDRPPVRRN